MAAEDKFETQSADPKVSDTNKYTKITNVNKYTFLDDAYYGSGGFRDGTYLIPHTREMFYKDRRQLASYKNYIRPIVRALIEPVFTETAPRVVTDSEGEERDNLLVNTFIEDVDNDKTHIQDFSEDVITKARRHGVTFVVVDNFPEEEQPPTTAAAIEGRIMPYVISKTGNEVETYKVDEFGRLTEIMFAEPSVVVSGQKERRARQWTAEYSVMMKMLQTGGGAVRTTGVSTNKWVEAGPRVYHNLGEIPVISVYAIKRKKKSEILVDPPLYDVARLNAVIFNKDSEIRDNERAQAFSNLFVQSDQSGNFTVGPHNVILVPMDATIAPGFASPNPGILAGLVENNEKNRADLFRMAEQMGVYAVETSKAESGVALAWKFFGQEAQLKKTARLATDLEHSIMTLFKLYTQEEFEYVVDYPFDYQPGDRLREVTIYKEIVNLNPPDKMRKKIFEKIARIMFVDEEAEVLQEIIEDIHAEKTPQTIKTETEEPEPGEE